MSAASDLPTLYKTKKVYLWVEDDETRTYLSALWEDPDVGILVAAGHGNIHAVVRSSREEGFTHVFGFRDRDFGKSNRARWREPTTEVMTSEAFELENLALDSEAIAACDVNTSGKSVLEITKDLEQLAAGLPWWMSCRSIITRAHDQVLGAFIGHPKRARVTTQAEAEAAIFASEWWTSTLPSIASHVNRDTVANQLQAQQGLYSAMLETDAWRVHYSGKEVLRDMVTRVWTKGRPKVPHTDFVKAIARAQRAASRIPPEIEELRAVLRERTGLPP